MSRFSHVKQPEEGMITIDEAVREIQEAQAELIAQHQMQCQRAAELERREWWIQKQTNALDARKRQLDAAEEKLKAVTRTVKRMEEPVSQRSRAVVGWFQRHDPIVGDWRPSSYIYDEVAKKEIKMSESKTAYLNRVVDEMPVDISYDERFLMFKKILSNPQSKSDSLLCLKLDIALIADKYVEDNSHSSEAVAPSIFFFSLFMPKTKIVTNAEEIERVRKFENTVLRAKDSDNAKGIDLIKTAMYYLETSDDKTGVFSNVYQKFLAECRVLIETYEPQLVSASVMVF